MFFFSTAALDLNLHILKEAYIENAAEYFVTYATGKYNEFNT